MILAKTITLQGCLTVKRSDMPKSRYARQGSSRWKVGDTCFTIGPGNGWVTEHLLKFRRQKTLVECWIREDGTLLAVRTLVPWNHNETKQSLF